MTPAGTEEKASVRETYKLIGEVEGRLGDKIEEVRTELGSKIDGLKDNVIERVVTLEAHQVEDRKDIDDHATRLSTLEGAHQRALGHLSAWKLAGGVLGGAATIVIADIVFKALGG